MTTLIQTIALCHVLNIDFEVTGHKEYRLGDQEETAIYTSTLEDAVRVARGMAYEEAFKSGMLIGYKRGDR